MAPRPVQRQQKSLAPLVVAVAVVAAGVCGWLGAPSIPVLLAGFVAAAWMEPPTVLTGKKDSSGFATPAHAGEQANLARSRFWRELKWRLFAPSGDWLPGRPPRLSWLAAVGGAATAAHLPVTDQAFTAANALAAFATIVTVAGARRRNLVLDDEAPATSLSDLRSYANRSTTALGIIAGVAGAAGTALAATAMPTMSWVGNRGSESPTIYAPLGPIGMVVVTAATAALLAVLPRCSRNALEHWRDVVAARSEWAPRWDALKQDPAPRLTDRQRVGAATVDTFDAPSSAGAMAFWQLAGKVAPTLGPGFRVAILDTPNEDSNGPIPGTRHPLRFEVVVWPSGELPDPTDPSTPVETIELFARCATVWALDTVGYARPVLLSTTPITDQSPVAAWMTTWAWPDGPSLTEVRSLVGDLSAAFGCDVIIDSRGAGAEPAMYFGGMLDPDVEFAPRTHNGQPVATDYPTLMENLSVEDHWDSIWAQVSKQGTNPPTVQHAVRSTTELGDGTVINRQAFVTRTGIDPSEYRGLEPKLATALSAAPFVCVTGWTTSGTGRRGERHPQAFVVYWANSAVPATPDRLASSPAAINVLAGHVNAAFDAAKLARPEIVNATSLTTKRSSRHLWQVSLRLYGGVTLADVRSRANRLRSAFGAQWLRVAATDDGCDLYVGGEPEDVDLARPKQDLPRLIALDWEQAFADSGVTGNSGLLPELVGTDHLPRNEQVQVLDFRLPPGLDHSTVKASIGKLRTATGNDFIDARPGANASEIRLLVSELNPLPTMVGYDFVEIDSSDGIPFATGVDGEPVVFRPDAAPHALVAGKTGAGKSVLAQSFVYGALVRRWDVYIVDPVKGGADFVFARPYAKGFATTAHEAAATMKHIYAEVVRRKDRNAAAGVGSYLELDDPPPHLVVFIDEFTSLMGKSFVPKSDDPDLAAEIDEIVAENIAREQVGMLSGKIAREARSAGVTLLLGTQKLAAKMLDTIPGASDLKLLTLDSRLPVPISERFPDGWARNRDLVEGDLLYTPKGTTAPIVGFSPVTVGGTVYEVEFSDGRVVKTGPGHWWLASDAESRARHGRWKERSGTRRLAIAERAYEAADVLPVGTHLSPSELAKIVGYADPARIVHHAKDLGCDRKVRSGDGTLIEYDRDLRRGAPPRRFLAGDAAQVLAGTRSWSDVEPINERADKWLTAREIGELVTGGRVSARTAGNIGTLLVRAGCESKTGEPEPYLLDAIGFLRALATKLRDQVGADAETGAPLALERLVTTEEMRHSVSVREGARANWAVRVSAPIDGPDVDLPVDPYVLGAWLGDGSTGAGVLTQGTAEECTDESGLTDQAHLLEQLNAAGYNARVLPCHSNLIGTRGLLVPLRELGVLHDKHIPAAYLRSSAAQRLALLQGLMDTDGSVMASGTCSLPQVSERIHEGALELIESLGFKASVSGWDAAYMPEGATEKKVTGWVHHISFSPNLPVFRLPRKLAKQRPSSDRFDITRWRYVRSIREIASEPVRCIGIDDPDHLYLVEGFIPTHNTNMARTLLGKASFGDRASALASFEDAPVLEGDIPKGRGLWEPLTGSAEIIQAWFSPQSELETQLSSRLDPLGAAEQLMFDAPATPSAGRPISAPAEVVDVGEFTFTLDDLPVLDADEERQPESVDWAAATPPPYTGPVPNEEP